MRSPLLSALSLALALALTSSPPEAAAQNLPAASVANPFAGCLPQFPLGNMTQVVNQAPNPNYVQANTRAYLGGDGGLSCALNGNSAFWSFCDVATSAPNQNNRSSAYYTGTAANVIAIATCDPSTGSFSPRYYYGGDTTYKDANNNTQPLPLGFFPDASNVAKYTPRWNTPTLERLWLRKAFLYNGNLFVFAHQVENVGSGGDPTYNTILIRVNNPQSDPSQWTYPANIAYMTFDTQANLSTTTFAPVAYGLEAFVYQGYLFFYGVYAPSATGYDAPSSTTAAAGGTQVTVHRLYLPNILGNDGANLGPNTETLMVVNGVQSWVFTPNIGAITSTNSYYDPQIPAFQSFTVRYNATLKVWQAVYLRDGDVSQYQSLFLTQKNNPPTAPTQYVASASFMNVSYSTNGPFGPFGGQSAQIATSQRSTFPEMDPQNPLYNVDNLCYFAGERPEYRTSDSQIVIGYTPSTIGYPSLSPFPNVYTNHAVNDFNINNVRVNAYGSRFANVATVTSDGQTAPAATIVAP